MKDNAALGRPTRAETQYWNRQLRLATRDQFESDGKSNAVFLSVIGVALGGLVLATGVQEVVGMAR